MKFSLIMCTVGRTDTLTDAICSIESQSFRDFELIIVDQNKDNRLTNILNSFSEYNNIVYVRSDISGLSANRNIGLTYAKGNIIAFPDDDCQYLPDTLETIYNRFASVPDMNFITINIKGLDSETYFINNHTDVALNRYNFKPFAISIGIFIRFKNISDIVFDEQLGAGRYFGATEESDMVSELIDNGYVGKYLGSIYVLHPTNVQNLPYEKIVARYKSYNLGFGAFMKKEIVKHHKYPLIIEFMKDLFLRFIGAVIPNKKRRLLWISFIYRIKGFVEYKFN